MSNALLSTFSSRTRTTATRSSTARLQQLIATGGLKKSTEAVKKFTGGVYSRAVEQPDNVQHDLERIQGAVRLRCKHAEKVRNKKAYLSDDGAHPSKLLSLLIVAAHDGQASGAEYDHPRQPEELAKMLIAMNGTAKDWYSGLPIRLSGGPIHKRVIVPTQQATNFLFGDMMLEERVLYIHSLKRHLLPSPIYDQFAPNAPPVDEANLDHFDWRLLQIHRSQRSATDTRNGKRGGAGQPPLDQPWSLEALKDSFMKEAGQCAITGGSVLDSRIYWSLSCDRNSDDLPYNENNIQWMPWPLNRAKAAFSVFNHKEALEAEGKERGIDDPKQLVKEIMLEWLMPLLENFKPTIDLLLTRLAAYERPPDMWDGDAPVKDFFKDGGGRILIHDEDIYDWLEGWADEEDGDEGEEEQAADGDGRGGEEDELSEGEILAADALHRVMRNI